MATEPLTRSSSALNRRPIDTVWAILPALLPALVSLLSNLGTIDLAYHVRAGDLLIDAQAVPRVDTFTFTVAGEPWFDQQWGAQLILSVLHALGGWSTLGVVEAALIGFSFWLVARTARIQGASARAASLLAIAGFLVGALTLTIRPQLLAVPLVALAVLLTTDRARHPGRLWFIPLLAAINANLHGSFILYPVIVGLAWFDDKVERRAGRGRLLAIGGLSILATFATPFGPLVWRYAFELATDPVIRETITEWAPVTLSTITGALMVVSAIAVAVFAARRPRSVPWGAVATLVLFFVMAMLSYRAILWWGLIAPVVVAGLLGDGTSQLPTTGRASAAARESTAPARVLILGLVAAAILLLPWWRSGTYESNLDDAPHGIVRAVREGLPDDARLFVFQEWASWFEYALPEMTVFVDSRIELFPESVWVDYGQVAFARDGWREALDRWDPDAIVADVDWELLPRLRDSPTWEVAYEDEDGVLLIPA